MPMRWKCKSPIYMKGMKIPCGQCVYCRMNDTRDWSVSSVNEMRYYKNGCFITLTYDDKKVEENPYKCEYYDKERYALPLVYSLRYEDLIDFFKRLRDFYQNNTDKFLVDKVKVIGKKKPCVYPEIKYIACGEYGEKDVSTHRPHFHAIVFGLDFADKYRWRRSKKDRNKFLYRSPTLEKLWQYGHCEIAPVEEDDIQYVAGYEQKKIKSKNDEYYFRLFKLPPKRFVSKGLGKKYCEEFADVLRRDQFLYYKGKPVGMPKRYKKWLFTDDEIRELSALNRYESQKRDLDKYFYLVNEKGMWSSDAIRLMKDKEKQDDIDFHKNYKNKERIIK